MIPCGRRRAHRRRRGLMSQREHQPTRGAATAVEATDPAADQASGSTSRLSYAGGIPAGAPGAAGPPAPSASDRGYGDATDVGARLRALLNATTIVFNQAHSDHTHVGLIREQEAESPVIAGSIKVAARVREMATFSPKGGLALPSQIHLSILQDRLGATRQLLKDAQADGQTNPAYGARVV